MAANADEGADDASGEGATGGNASPMATTAEVRAAVGRVQRAHRASIRWGIGRHTAELALSALDDARERRVRRAPHAKRRRRKRYKRLL